jgi:hypothetical protein
MSNFADTNNGFHMTFANGWTVSVQWNHGTYCERYGKGVPGDSGWSSTTAEVYAWHTDADGIEQDWQDGVQGWQTADDVAKFIAEIAAKE